MTIEAPFRPGPPAGPTVDDGGARPATGVGDDVEAALSGLLLPAAGPRERPAGPAAAPAAPPTRTRRLARIASRLLAVLALGILFLTLAAAVVPRMLGLTTVVVTSGSMGDSAPTGSIVVGAEQPRDTIGVGDVVLRQEGAGAGPQNRILHRVIRVGDRNGQRVVWTKGDANPAPDPEPYALPDQALVAQGTLPYAGYLVAALGTRLGWALLVGLPAIVLALTMIWSIWAPIVRSGRREA